MQSESNSIRIILRYSILCITGIFLMFPLKQWQKPTFCKVTVWKEISCANVLKTWDPQDPGFLSAKKEAPESGLAGSGTGGTAGKLCGSFYLKLSTVRCAGRRNSHSIQRAPG